MSRKPDFSPQASVGATAASVARRGGYGRKGAWVPWSGGHFFDRRSQLEDFWTFRGQSFFRIVFSMLFLWFAAPFWDHFSKRFAVFLHNFSEHESCIDFLQNLNAFWCHFWCLFNACAGSRLRLAKPLNLMTLRRNSMVYHLRKAWISMILLTSFAVFLCNVFWSVFALIWAPFRHPSTIVVHVFRCLLLGRFLG